MSAQLSEGPGEFVSVGGAGRASTLVELDVIDEYRPFVNPVVLGGTPCFPARDERLDLELVERRGPLVSVWFTCATVPCYRPRARAQHVRLAGETD
jgi:dihydrofolate reductase